jgi:TolA-binding protein
LALATFQKYLDKYKNEDPLFSASAQAGIAQCQYTLGNFALAGDNFMKAASMAEEADFLAPQYLNLAGEAYALANMLDKAKAAYQKVIDQYKNTKYVNIARRNLAEIS